MIKSNIKIVFLGESSIGKTSIVHRLIRDVFNDNPESTIGASFMTYEKDNIRYNVWDTAGQERYMSLSQMYYRNSDIILLVFDVSNIETINKLLLFLDKLVIDLKKDNKIIIIGNKTDLVTEVERLAVDNILTNLLKKDKYNDILNQIEYLYVSAKSGENCLELSEMIYKFGTDLVKAGKQSQKNTIGVINYNSILPSTSIINPNNNGKCSC